MRKDDQVEHRVAVQSKKGYKENRNSLLAPKM